MYLEIKDQVILVLLHAATPAVQFFTVHFLEKNYKREPNIMRHLRELLVVAVLV